MNADERFEHFDRIVRDNFAFLISEYSFKVAESDHAAGEIWLEFRSPKAVVVHVDFEPRGGVDLTLRRERAFGRTIGANIRDILPEDVAAQIVKVPLDEYAEHEVERQISKYANVLQRYGRSILLGNDQWLKLRPRKQ